MKKKLLTVLLAVVMVFGVFGLTACGAGTNPDEGYNYYGTKYELDGDVKIEAATYQTVYRMFTTAGNFLLYVDSEDNAASRFQAINKLAQEWDVTIYHFNPDLSGGYGADNTSKQNTNILTLSAEDTIAYASQLKAVQDNLLAMSGKDEVSELKDNSLWAIKGAVPTATLSGEGEGATATLKYSSSVAAISGTKASDDENAKTLTNADVVASIALRKPSYAQYAENGNTAVPAAYNTGNINTMNLFADNRLHMYNDDGTDAFLDEKTDVYVTVANYEQFAHLMDNNEGYFAVFFGGTWCPNTQAIAMLTNDLAKDYGISKIYMFDPRLDNGTRAIYEAAVETDEEGNQTAVASKANSTYLASNLNTRNGDKTGAAYNFNYLYAQFLDEYLPDYDSEWNYGVTFQITSNGKVGTYTKMCVPNIMMFNGEDEGAAEMVALAEAEYSYANTSVEGDPQNVEWINAVKAVFDTNKYAYYAPLPDAVEETEDTASDSSSSSSSSSSSAGGSTDAGGC